MERMESPAFGWPQRAFVALVVDPLFVRYSPEGALVSLDGRVPTKLKQGDDWADFDAHVDDRNEGAFR